MSMADDSAFPHRVLENGSRGEILEKLQHTARLESWFADGDRAYQAILRNEKLTAEDIITIANVFRDRGLNPDITNSKAKIGMHLAIEKKLRNVTEYFIKSSEDNNTEPSPELSHELIKLFIEDEYRKFWFQAKQNYDNSSFWDSLKVERDSAILLECLIPENIDCGRKHKRGKSFLRLALDHNLQHLLPILLKRSNITIDNGPASSQLLLDKFFRKNGFARTYGYLRTQWYSSYTSRYAVEIVKILLDKGAALNWKENVQLAIEEKEEIGVIELLLHYFPDDCNDSSLATDLLNLLMKYSSVDSETDRYLQILRSLVSKGADVRSKITYDMSPVQIAVKANNIHAVDWLNEVDADFGVLTEDGQNLLHLLVDKTRDQFAREVAILDLLVRKGCQINAKDENGQTPLHLAAKHYNVAIVKALIEYDADINCRDNKMRTPLHHAAMSYAESVQLVELLLENGARANVKDIEGMVPLFFAVLTGSRNSWMVEVLLKWGAQVNTLHDIGSVPSLRNIACSMPRTFFQKFLSYGLQVKPSRLFRLFDEHRRDITKLLALHCVKLEAVKLPCSKVYKFHLEYDHYQEHYRACVKEIAILKKTFIDSHTSLYRLLHMDFNQRCTYINNQKLKKLIDSSVRDVQFPEYFPVILASYRETMGKKLLLEPAKEAWLELTGIHLPDICIERILSYLSNADLVDIIETNFKSEEE